MGFSTLLKTPLTSSVTERCTGNELYGYLPSMAIDSKYPLLKEFLKEDHEISVIILWIFSLIKSPILLSFMPWENSSYSPPYIHTHTYSFHSPKNILQCFNCCLAFWGFWPPIRTRSGLKRSSIAVPSARNSGFEKIWKLIPLLLWIRIFSIASAVFTGTVDFSTTIFLDFDTSVILRVAFSQ